MTARQTDIAVFFPSLTFGGVERIFVTLTSAFVARGYTVDLVVGTSQGEFRHEVSPEIQIVDLKTPPPHTHLRLPGLARYIRRVRPTVLLAATDGSNLVAVWANKLAGGTTRIVTSSRVPWNSHALYAAQQGLLNAFKYRLIMPAMIRRTYPYADALIAISQGVARDIAEVSGVPQERINVIYNPAITPQFREMVKARVEHPWFVAGAPPVVLAAGRLSTEKDFHTLIRAFALVRRSRQVRLMIVGEGPERGDLERLVQTLDLQDAVSLPGYFQNPYPFMRESAALVVSSLYEGFGNVMVEAMAAGTPVVSTNCCCGPAEILDRGTYGPLVPVRNPERLAEAILATLDAPLPPEMLRQRAEAFTMEKSVDDYLRVLLPDKE